MSKQDAVHSARVGSELIAIKYSSNCAHFTKQEMFELKNLLGGRVGVVENLVGSRTLEHQVVILRDDARTGRLGTS